MGDQNRSRTVSGAQWLVLGFFAATWGALVVILAVAPEVYDRQLRSPPDVSGIVRLAFFGAISAFLVSLTVGVLRRWRWVFWLILIAFLLGPLRVLASALELTNVIESGLPAWYVVLQAVIGLVQFGLGLAMLVGYRRGGVWGGF